MAADQPASTDQEDVRRISHGQWRPMGRIAWRTSLLPLLLPLVAVTAAIILAARSTAPDQIQMSIIERWTPFAALLGAAVVVAQGRIDVVR